jgi:hypothetical protein
VIGGFLRVVFSFDIVPVSGRELEVMYDITDVALLFGLMGIYFADSDKLSPIGFLGFVVAETGIASIVGPDTVAYGIDTYQIGVMVISVGLSLLAVTMLVLRSGSSLAALCWLGSTGAGALGNYSGHIDMGFFVAGILFGVGFISGGVALFRNATP